MPILASLPPELDNLDSVFRTATWPRANDQLKASVHVLPMQVDAQRRQSRREFRLPQRGFRDVVIASLDDDVLCESPALACFDHKVSHSGLNIKFTLYCQKAKTILRSTNRPLVVPAQLTVEPGLVGAAILGGLS